MPPVIADDDTNRYSKGIPMNHAEHGFLKIPEDLTAQSWKSQHSWQQLEARSNRQDD